MKVKFCKTSWSKFKGLMFSKKLNKVLIFINKKEKNTPIHMLFVFYPIDVIWLNSKKEVIKIKRNLKPFSYINPKVKAKYVLEVPVNYNKNIKIKDTIKL
ncbi:MAG: DUF192 domain-containing protein [Nanoarchaeota archaeon]|nr:DUF192 domain-containing protein [Nanoarchaeota archaeon]